MNIFIDTNIFLAFFQFTSDDLEELKKLAVLLRQQKVRLWLPEQVKMEFQRNRENKILEALKRLREQKLNLQFPALCKDYEEFESLRGYQREYEQKHAKLVEKINQDVESQKLKADLVIGQLFALAENISTDEEILGRAQIRSAIGNPPGKGDSLGDAINWESLLLKVPDGESLHLVTDDKDFYSPIDELRGNTFLQSEWWSAKQSEIVFYRQISRLFREHFPSIKLASEFEKELLISDLTDSRNFAQTHMLIAKLKRVSDFTTEQLKEIVNATANNSQINWIINDPDIKIFFLDLVKNYGNKMDAESLVTIQTLLTGESSPA